MISAELRVWIRFRVMSVAVLVLASALVGGARSLPVEVELRFGDAPLAFDVVTNVTAAGQTISVTRLDFLLSSFALRRAHGGWFVVTNHFAYINGREQRTAFELPSVPEGNYDRLRFSVGVPERENHASPGAFMAEHPLNPNLNGLHWSWQGGYVFFALEGKRAGGGGYSYHVATDRLLVAVELPIAGSLRADFGLRFALRVEEVFSKRHRIEIDEATASTHSREGDALASRLRENIKGAFSPAMVMPPRSGAARMAVRSSAILVATNATPYPLAFPGYFPLPKLPADNPLTVEGVDLGRRLFHDPRLSLRNSLSCASCHQEKVAFTDAGQRFSLGAEGRRGRRNAMPLFNLAWKSSFFWDGRVPTLREQVLQPIQDADEMHGSLADVVRKLVASEPDSARFAAAFGTAEVSADRMARALEQYLLAQVARDSKFDRSLAGAVELTAEERRGFELFHTEYDPRRGLFGADCFHCHGGPLFQSQAFANNGLDAVFSDQGRYEVTKREGDRGRFAVPALRDVARTAPYMHDGRFATLEEVVAHYVSGVKRSATLDANLAKHPEGGVPLSAEDQRALVAFLKTLTSE